MMRTKKLTISLLAVMMAALFLNCSGEVLIAELKLDTPARHVRNGNKLLKTDKLHAAEQEYGRALELDPEYAPAQVGLGLVKGHQGQFEQAMDMLHQAAVMAKSQKQQAEVAEAIKTVENLRQNPQP